MSKSKEQAQLTVKAFYDGLRDKVSSQNAKLILESALIPMGIKATDESTELTVDQAKDLCLQMINRGGPAFNVAQSIYRTYLQ